MAENLEEKTGASFPLALTYATIGAGILMIGDHFANTGDTLTKYFFNSAAGITFLAAIYSIWPRGKN
jgi:uracil-DNA glycosylase